MKSRAAERVDLVITELSTPGTPADAYFPALLHVLAIACLTRDSQGAAEPNQRRTPTNAEAVAAVEEALRWLALMSKKCSVRGEIRVPDLLGTFGWYVQNIIVDGEKCGEA